MAERESGGLLGDTVVTELGEPCCRECWLYCIEIVGTLGYRVFKP